MGRHLKMKPYRLQLFLALKGKQIRLVDGTRRKRLLQIIVHVLATTPNPKNTSDVECLNAAEENCSIPVFSKIIGGKEVQPMEFPPIAALVIKRDDSESVCTGTILNKYFVLTAGHCITNSLSITIFIDCVELYNCKEEKQGLGILHPRYGKTDNVIVNDIGLVRSSSPLSTTVHTHLSTVTSYYQGCVVMGYGFTSESLRVFNKKLYKLEVLKVVPCTYLFPTVVTNPSISTMVCSQAKDNRRYNFGDSGGPLLCNNTQVGVTSQLIRYSEHDDSKVTIMSWVPVSLYVEWITTVTSSTNFPSSVLHLAVLLTFVIFVTR